MELNLIFHNIGFILGTIIALVMAVFVYFRDRKAVQNITFSLGFVFIAIFCLTHVIGVNIADPYISRAVLMGNISIIFITCFLAHCSFAIAGVLKKQKLFLIVMYVIAIILTVIYLIFPDTYLLPSQAKMYFPNYYVAGNLQWIMRIIFDIIVPLYFMTVLVYAYRSADTVMRNRLWYFFLANVLGYCIGSMAILLVYDIPVDPLWASAFVPVLAIPMSYAIVRYSLMDIRVVAKRALVFGIVLAFVSFGIFVIGYANYAITTILSKFPNWLMPTIGGFGATAIGFFVWNKFREADQLKYEFITTIIHKFRTPLTSINWSVENMLPRIPPDMLQDLEHVKEGADKLVQLTDFIVHSSNVDSSSYVYEWKKSDVNVICDGIIKDSASKARQKNIDIVFKPSSDEANVRADVLRLQSVFDILLNNAIEYSPSGSRVLVSVLHENSNIKVDVIDSGIGLSSEEIRSMFSKFYRTTRARSVDTEGLGIGLFLAREIIGNHGGKIKVHSDGTDKGSTFSVTLPFMQS